MQKKQKKNPKWHQSVVQKKWDQILTTESKLPANVNSSKRIEFLLILKSNLIITFLYKKKKRFLNIQIKKNVNKNIKKPAIGQIKKKT